MARELPFADFVLQAGEREMQTRRGNLEQVLRAKLSK